MIKLVLLTGFLGSGKTTLMQRTLEAFSDKKTGVIVNEFGSVNIDAVLLKRDGIQMAELSNGSIFCACIKDKFVDSLIKMSKTNIEYLFIEASGLADPANMTTILNGIKHMTNNLYDYRGSICIADAENFLDLSVLLPSVAAQLEFCCAAIINKADLVDADKIEEVKCGIKKFNDKADIYTTQYCQVDIRKIIENMKMNKLDACARESSNTRANRADTFVVKGEGKTSYNAIKKFLGDVVNDSYRIKGFVDTDRGVMEISTVGKNIYMNSWAGPKVENEIVIISSVGFKMMSTITSALEKHLKGEMHL